MKKLPFPVVYKVPGNMTPISVSRASKNTFVKSSAFRSYYKLSSHRFLIRRPETTNPPPPLSQTKMETSPFPFIQKFYLSVYLYRKLRSTLWMNISTGTGKITKHIETRLNSNLVFYITSVRSLIFKNPRDLSPGNQTRNSKQPGTRHVGLWSLSPGNRKESNVNDM